MTSDEEKIIEQLALQEAAIASLYAVFAEALPEMRDFWLGLVAEEKAHAAVVWNLAELCTTSDTRINAHAFNVETIQTNIAYLNRQGEAAKANGITALKALSLALDTEKGLIDREFFRVIKSDNPTIENELAAIQEHTRAHFHHIEQQIQVLRSEAATTRIQDGRIHVIIKLAECERLLAELYEVYSATIAGMKPFWRAISNCEITHATMLELLADGIRDGRTTVHTEHISLKGIALLQELVRDAIAKGKGGSLAAQEAIVTAISVESAVVEGDLYKTVESDASEFRDIAARLVLETNQHIDSLQQALQDYK